MVRTLSVTYLLVQGIAVYLWWGMLIFFPATREPFKAPDAPDSTLLAFLGADLLVYGGGSLVAAYGIAHHKEWAWMALCVVSGASVYGALYALTLPLFSGGAWFGALLMAPSLVVPPLLVWLFRPTRR
jgi:uncharacterized membrane protein (DUF2068 family)